MLFNIYHIIIRLELPFNVLKKFYCAQQNIVDSALFYIKEYGITICIGMEI